MRNPNQDLANLTGKTVSGLNVGRLASKYAPVANARRAQDLANERELELGWGHLEALRKKVSEELEKASEEMASDMPIASTFDALQEVKTHKDVGKDAGLRALMGHLEKSWKRDREGSISAASLGELRKHYARTFPKSAVVGVLDKIAKNGYACLEMSKLAQIAEEIETQDDYDRLMVEHGLNGKQPNQVKARKFVLGLVNRRAQMQNTNPAFGDAVTVGAGDVDALLEEMKPLFMQWVEEKVSSGEYEDEESAKAELLDRIQNEFLSSFQEVGPVEAARRFVAKLAQYEDEDEESEDEEFEDEGPQEGDYIISSGGRLGGSTYVSEFEGRWSEEVEDEDEAEWVIAQRMKEENFFPNVWFQDDHGGFTLTSIDIDKVKAPVRDDEDEDEEFEEV